MFCFCRCIAVCNVVLCFEYVSGLAKDCFNSISNGVNAILHQAIDVISVPDSNSKLGIWSNKSFDEDVIKFQAVKEEDKGYSTVKADLRSQIRDMRRQVC